MRSNKEIKRLFENAVVNTNPRKDGRVLEDMLAAQKTGDAQQMKNHWNARRMAAMSSIAKLAVAGVVLIVAGYVVARVTAPPIPDMEQLRSELEDSLRSSLRASLRGELVEQARREQQVLFAHGYARLRADLDEALRRQLESYSLQTLAASSALTEHVAAALVEAIRASRVDEHRRVAAVLEQMEVNRLLDSASLRKDFATFATLTGDEVLRTRHAVVNLLRENTGDEAFSAEPEEAEQENERTRR